MKKQNVLAEILNENWGELEKHIIASLIAKRSKKGDNIYWADYSPI